MAFVQVSTTKTHKGETSINKLVECGRTTGKYRLLGAGLTEVPSSVYDGKPLDGVAFWDEVPPQTLDLSRNELQNLPNELGCLTELVSLSISHNRLTTVPDSLSLLIGLKSLDISHNKLSAEPAALASLSSLQQLACGSNQFTSLQLGHVSELAELSAEANRLASMPHGLAGCSKLSKLLLSGNAFTNVTLKGLSALKELDLSSNQLEGTLDASIGALSRLQILTLRQNRLTALPKELAGCASLSELHLGFNQISTLPEELGELSSLSVLDVRNNTLRNFPIGACRLSLSLLDLSNNNVAMLPPKIGRMTTLRALLLMGNPIRGYSSAVVNGPISVLLAKLRHRLEEEDSRPGFEDAVAADMLSLAIGSNSSTICLADRDLCQIPEQVWGQGVQLKQLDLSNNKLQQLPAERLAWLTGLQTLLLARNQLHTWPLPSGTGALPHLQELSVAYSIRSPVPEDAFKACMASLTCLDLSGVPASLHRGCLGGLTALKSLLWEKASLAHFPADIPQLTALETLSLMSNNIAEVPDTLTHLTSLTLLNISNCNIASLPPQLGLLGSLRTLLLDGNPLRTIRRPILERGTKAVLEYLKDRIPSSPGTI